MEDNIRIRKEQARLAELVMIKDDFSKLDYIGGADFTTIDNKKIIAGVIVCDKEMKILDKAYHTTDIEKDKLYPEGTAIVNAAKKLSMRPDVLLVNGPGITHRKLGLASFIGIALDLPTIGVAKNVIGAKIIDELVYIENEIRGYELFTREASRPVYISPGHKVSIKKSINIAKDSIRWPHKLPEPLALAHKYVNKLKNDILIK